MISVGCSACGHGERDPVLPEDTLLQFLEALPIQGQGAADKVYSRLSRPPLALEQLQGSEWGLLQNFKPRVSSLLTLKTDLPVWKLAPHRSPHPPPCTMLFWSQQYTLAPASSSLWPPRASRAGVLQALHDAGFL